jgi:DNA polymerase-3 subunit beta
MEHRFSIPQNVLKEALKKTSFAAAASHFRQVFTGVLFDIIAEGELKIVASDTHRLAYYSYPLPDGKIEPFSFIIPTRTVNELIRILDDDEEVIDIASVTIM